jgi:hypothetical protein
VGYRQDLIPFGNHRPDGDLARLGRLACFFEGAVHEPQVADDFGFWFARVRLCGFVGFKVFGHGADNSSRARNEAAFVFRSGGAA